MDSAMLITWVTIVFSGFVSFGFAFFWYRLSLARTEREKMEAKYAAIVLRVDTMDRQLALVGHDVVPISAALQQMLIKELTHFHTPVMDALMARLGPPSTLSEEEEAKLLRLLKEREIDMGDQISDSERDAAHILPVIMKRAKAEALALSERPSALQTVAILPPELDESTGGYPGIPQDG